MAHIPMRISNWSHTPLPPNCRHPRSSTLLVSEIPPPMTSSTWTRASRFARLTSRCHLTCSCGRSPTLPRRSRAKYGRGEFAIRRFGPRGLRPAWQQQAVSVEVGSLRICSFALRAIEDASKCLTQISVADAGGTHRKDACSAGPGRVSMRVVKRLYTNHADGTGTLDHHLLPAPYVARVRLHVAPDVGDELGRR